jgi:molybdate transport system regulatory protein
MPSVRRTRSAVPGGITGHIKAWFDIDGAFFVGPRYIKLLEGIDATGTIRNACLGSPISYRTCHNRIRQKERALGRPLVVTSRGGRAHGHATMTPEAQRLIQLYQAWRGRLYQASDRAFAAALRKMRQR